jgi:hypothetical protein
MEHMAADEMKADRIHTMGAPLGELFNYLERETVWLAGKWNDFAALYHKSQDQIDLLNATAPSFFGQIQGIMWEDAILHLCRLLDPPQSAGKDNLTFRRLPPLIGDAALRTSVESTIDLALTHGQFARDWRNRRLAHCELPPLQGQPAKAVPRVMFAEMESSVDAVCYTLRIIYRHYYPNCDTEYRRPLDALGGVNALTSMLDKALAAAKQPRQDYFGY